MYINEMISHGFELLYSILSIFSSHNQLHERRFAQEITTAFRTDLSRIETGHYIQKDQFYNRTKNRIEFSWYTCATVALLERYYSTYTVCPTFRLVPSIRYICLFCVAQFLIETVSKGTNRMFQVL